jgi:hypothetical protein
MSLPPAVAHYRITTRPGEGGILDYCVAPGAMATRLPRRLNREAGITEVAIEWT